MPTQVFAGEIRMLTRKVTEDWLFLQPEAQTVNLVGYMSTYWGDRIGIRVLAIIVLGNHIHIIYQDLRGRSPDWVQMVSHWISRVMNQRLGRTGNSFFKQGPSRPLLLPDAPSIVRRLLYTVTNAVRHGLCANSYAWPGLIFGPENAGETLKFRRPAELHNSEVFDETICYTVPAPPVSPPAGWRALRAEIEEAEHKKRNGKFMGVARAMALPKFSRPRNVKTGGRKLYFSTDNLTLRKQLALARKQFLLDYQRALTEFRNGNRDVEWPPGTYKMRRCYSLPPP